MAWTKAKRSECGPENSEHDTGPVMYPGVQRVPGGGG